MVMSNKPSTVGAALDEAAAKLSRLGADARREAEHLLSAVTGRARAALLANPGMALNEEQARKLQRWLERRLQGEPLAYLAGRKEFWSIDLEVDARVLVPRPETELLVEFALEVLPPDKHPRVLDLGTGSGAVALAIARERPDARVVATDVSADALAVACRNAERLGLANVSFEVGHWYEPVGAMHFDLIASNPPYVAGNDPALTADGLRREPRVALTSGPTGLEALQLIAARACEHLRPHGWLVVEHGATQADAVATLFSAQGLSTIRSLRDLAGLPRATAGRHG
jgi:release factor glutamine methyltransferase